MRVKHCFQGMLAFSFFRNYEGASILVGAYLLMNGNNLTCWWKYNDILWPMAAPYGVWQIWA